jgi:TRAP-type mannitol/chloroaromatic compound transport system substrate-binding protein
MMGFDKAAKYYYTGWHEPGSILEITFNKIRWEKLSSEHQAIITSASEEMTSTMVQEFRYKNAKALQELPKEIEIKTFPKDMMDMAKVALKEVLDKEAKKSKDFKRVLDNYNKFVKLNTPWNDISTKHILEIRG